MMIQGIADRRWRKEHLVLSSHSDCHSVRVYTMARTRKRRLESFSKRSDRT